MGNIYIVGYMGSGKSTLGNYLSKQIDLKFIDLDELITFYANKSINSVFKENGETYFRELERKALKASFKISNIVVATGGGTPTYKNNMDLMNGQGITIYLKASEAVLFNRLKKGKQHRPIIANLTDDALQQFIKEHLSQRKKHYQKANLHLNAADVLPLLLVKINKYLSKN